MSLTVIGIVDRFVDHESIQKKHLPTAWAIANADRALDTASLRTGQGASAAFVAKLGKVKTVGKLRTQIIDECRRVASQLLGGKVVAPVVPTEETFQVAKTEIDKALEQMKREQAEREKAKDRAPRRSLGLLGEVPSCY
jgi:hypothetical protein